MRATFQDFKTGWIGVSVALDPAEIDTLVDRLVALKSRQLGHFHFRRDELSESSGIADIEWSLKGSDEANLMHIQ